MLYFSSQENIFHSIFNKNESKLTPFKSIVSVQVAMSYQRSICNLLPASRKIFQWIISQSLLIRSKEFTIPSRSSIKIKLCVLCKELSHCIRFEVKQDKLKKYFDFVSFPSLYSNTCRMFYATICQFWYFWVRNQILNAFYSIIYSKLWPFWSSYNC